jgi:hypothetical protein
MKISGLLTVQLYDPSVIFVPYPGQPKYGPSVQFSWLPEGENAVAEIRHFLIGNGLLSDDENWPRKKTYFFDTRLDPSSFAKWHS